MSEFKFGYREKYIRQTAENILEGKFDLEEVKDAVDEGKTPEQVKEMLKQLKGVGEKVASCIQLFGLHQLSLFPVDTWIAKVEEIYYNGHFPVESYEGIAGVMPVSYTHLSSFSCLPLPFRHWKSCIVMARTDVKRLTISQDLLRLHFPFLKVLVWQLALENRDFCQTMVR